MADQSLREGLELFERIGLVAEMCYVAFQLARVQSESGDVDRAIAVASCVRSDPSSQQPYFFESDTTAELANEFLDDVSAKVEAGAFASAVLQGEMKGLDILVKELLNESTE